jgi:nucleotide-binding universal stress UspA family protein
MFKDILVAITRFEGDDAALKTGVRLARQEDAHLAVVIPVEFPVPVPNEWGVYPYQMYSAFYDDALKNANILAEELREKLAKEAIKFEVRVESTVLMTGAQTCAMNARYCDLAIVGAAAPGQKNLPLENNFIELLMNSGRPVLRVPQSTDTDANFDRVLIAWQPCREATRAVHDAMPLLGKAKSVDVLAVDPKVGETAHGEQPGADIAVHLARHDLSIRVVNQPAMSKTAGEAIVDYCKQTDAQLIVAGGYSHSRFREFVLGGVTRELCQHSPMPILFSH